MAKKKILKKQVQILWDALNAISVCSDINIKLVARKAMEDSVQLVVFDVLSKTRKQIKNELLENRRIIEPVTVHSDFESL